MKFHFITTTRNAEPWTERCVKSLLAQKDQPFTITIVDDASVDDTFGVAQRTFDEADLPENLLEYQIVRNEVRLGAPPNQCRAIELAHPEPEDVLIIVDGDDYLPHGDVLNKLASVYTDDVEMTYGSYEPDPPSPTCPVVKPYPQKVAEQRSFREYTRFNGCLFNHLRTFRYRLFSQIDQEKNFKWPNGEWFDFGVDFAFMMPLLELAGTNYRFIPDVLLMYNSENPASDWRRSAREADRIHHYVLADLPPVKAP